MTPQTLIGHLVHHAETDPTRLAVAFENTAITYGDLRRAVLRSAAVFRKSGVGLGERVMVAAAREPEFLYAYFACHVLGAIAVPYESDVPAPKFESVVDIIRPRVIVTNRPMAPLASDCTVVSLAELNKRPDVDGVHGFVEPNPEHPADVLLTSGTTGRSKGVTLTHRNILAAARNINQFIGNTADDREAVALPLSHSFGLGRVRCQILAGGALILTRGFQYPKQMFEAMKNWRATGFSFVPAAWAMLTRLTGDRLAETLPDLRYIEIGSAALSRSEKERLVRLFPSTRICMHYGLTEASRSAFIEFHQSRDRLDSIGQPSPNVEIRVVDERGSELGSQEVGRLQIRGEHVMEGYWNWGACERLHERLLYSGDLGYRDEDGYLYLCGREDDVINVGGRKVHPAEIEQALLAHECIQDAVCVATPDPLTGEAIRALLVAKVADERPTAEAVADLLIPRLEPFKIPAAFEWVSSIPRNASGKIDRKAVAALAPAVPRQK